MPAATKNFEVFKNEDWGFSGRLQKPDASFYDLAGSTMRMQVRPSAASSEIVIELNQTNGRLVFSAHPGDAGGVLTVWSIIVDKAILRQLPSGVFVYDNVWSRGTNDRRWLAGTVTLSEGATR